MSNVTQDLTGSGAHFDPKVVVATPLAANRELQTFARWLLNESGINWLEPIYDQVRERD